jgi:hypothetical protein
MGTVSEVHGRLSVPDDRSLCCANGYTRERRWWSNKRRCRVAQSSGSIGVVYSSLSIALGRDKQGKVVARCW